MGYVIPHNFTVENIQIHKNNPYYIIRYDLQYIQLSGITLCLKEIQVKQTATGYNLYIHNSETIQLIQSIDDYFVKTIPDYRPILQKDHHYYIFLTKQIYFFITTNLQNFSYQYCKIKNRCVLYTPNSIYHRIRMTDQLSEKTFKLLADPQKLKKTTRLPKDNLQVEIEFKFNYKLTHSLYDDILLRIKEEIILDKILQDIIHKAVNLAETERCHNPLTTEDS